LQGTFEHFETKMAKPKSLKKHTKKGHTNNGHAAAAVSSSVPNSPTRNSTRRRKRNMNLLSADDCKLRHEIEIGTCSPSSTYMVKDRMCILFVPSKN
jgi:hypothetical protein